MAQDMGVDAPPQKPTPEDMGALDQGTDLAQMDLPTMDVVDASPEDMSPVDMDLVDRDLEEMGPTDAPQSTGMSLLVVGNSFFVPVGRVVDGMLASRPNLFPDHVFDSHFRGGANGTVQKLWESMTDRQKILTKIERQKPQFLAVTVPFPGQDLSQTQYFENFFDAALQANPDVSFMIGGSWSPTFTDPSQSRIFARANTNYFRTFYPTVEALRAKYPGKVHMLHYGKVVELMHERFDTYKDLTDFIAPQGSGRELDGCLFSDSFGHVCTMPHVIMALVWLEMMYRAEDDTLQGLANDTPFDTAQMLSLGREVSMYNQTFYAP